MSWRRKSLYVLLLLITLVFTYTIVQLYRLPIRMQDTVVLLPPATSTNQIAHLLEQNKMLHDSRPFAWYARIAGFMGYHLMAGEYMITPQMRPYEILKLILSGKIMPRYITIPEGLSIRQIAALLDQTYGLVGTIDIINYPEGMLLPDTYQYIYGTHRHNILNRMQQAMRELLDIKWQERQPQTILRSAKEALILASIVEKEAQVAAERARIAALYLNRLRLGMLLQADPTVLYIQSNGTNKLSRNLNYQDLKVDSPYNTYKYPGLPPEPIANPGREALHAVLHAPNSQELYFVAEGNGAHRFAKTYTEHLKNVRHYRILQRQAAQKKD